MITGFFMMTSHIYVLYFGYIHCLALLSSQLAAFLHGGSLFVFRDPVSFIEIA